MRLRAVGVEVASGWILKGEGGRDCEQSRFGCGVEGRWNGLRRDLRRLARGVESRDSSAGEAGVRWLGGEHGTGVVGVVGDLVLFWGDLLLSRSIGERGESDGG